jgi:hypothetical protein
MWLLIVAAVCAGLFAGAAVYINLVEHPARLSCGPELAIREFAPSYHRATFMQAALAVAGSISGLGSAWLLRDVWLASSAVLLGAVVPFTLLVMFPINKQLLDPALDARSRRAEELLTSWGRLHAARSVLSSAAFVLFLQRLSVL